VLAQGCEGSVHQKFDPSDGRGGGCGPATTDMHPRREACGGRYTLASGSERSNANLSLATSVPASG
jgi:hypothetical protein